jgi:glycogen operon protein
VSELAYRLTGSSDLYAHNGRQPHASINFVTAHDGFTMWDLVSYSQKHNRANKEGNRDGRDENFSWNHGAEGETPDESILELRRRQVRNFLTTLMVSQGVPMILHGDEVQRTQRGNNNAYCHDSELTWQPWRLNWHQEEMFEWTRRVLRFRKEHSILHRRNYFHGRAIMGVGIKDISWHRPDGMEMTAEDWEDYELRALAVRLAGHAADVIDSEGNEIIGDTLALLFNANDEPLTFRVPRTPDGVPWEFVLDTSLPQAPAGAEKYAAGAHYVLESRAMAVLKHPTAPNGDL